MPSGICSACGFSNLPGELFCQKCGVQLGPVPSVPPPPPVPAGDPQVTPAATGGGFVTAAGVEIRLPPDRLELLIGRSDPVKGVFPDLDLAGFGAEEAGVSRLHARLLLQPGQPRIEDLNSTNFTFLNDQRLLPGRSYTLVDGDVVQFGRLRLVFRADLKQGSRSAGEPGAVQ